MGNLFYPQLASGALSQYPIRKTSLVRTVKNVLGDGSMVLYPDPNGGHRIWQLVYTDLGTADIQALESHFSACGGPYRAFTFIDPTENMLVWSSDFTLSPWRSVNLLQMQRGVADPDGGAAAFMVTNHGQGPLELSQTVIVPAGYQYCFSVYAISAQPAKLELTRRGGMTQEATLFGLGPNWSRLVSSGQLNDTSTQFTVVITLAAGQQLGLYGAQLEPQEAPSRYRPTASVGGIYANAHWGVDQLTTEAEAPNLYSTSFSIETFLKD